MELYNVLEKECEKNDEIVIDIEKLQNDISELDTEGQNICYALIKNNYVLTKKLNNFPYQGKQLKDGRIKFNLDEFPEHLIKIIYLFVNKHKQKINDDSNKQKNKLF